MCASPFFIYFIKNVPSRYMFHVNLLSLHQVSQETGSNVYESPPRKQKEPNKNYQERMRQTAQTFLWIVWFVVNLVNA